VQILASALPGFRDLRAPLTAGYLWLILLWILNRPDIKTRPANEVGAAIYDLAHHVGPIWVGIAVGIAAYLIGSISQTLATALNDAVIRMLSKARSMDAMQIENDVIQRYVEKYLNSAAKKLNVAPESDEIVMHGRTAVSGLFNEMEMPATLLLGKEPELFSEADRLKAESQLRLAIVPPLLAIVTVTMLTVSTWCGLGFLVAAILYWQGFKRSEEFRSLMLGAVRFGLIRSQSLEDLREWVDSLENTRTIR
jgi:hypothetical protein